MSQDQFAQDALAMFGSGRGAQAPVQEPPATPQATVGDAPDWAVEDALAMFSKHRAPTLADQYQQKASAIVGGAAEMVAGPIGFVSRWTGSDVGRSAAAAIRSKAMDWAPPSSAIAAQESFWNNTVPGAIPLLAASLGSAGLVAAGKISLGTMIAGEAAVMGPMTGEQVAMGVEQAGGSESAARLASLGGLAVGAAQSTAGVLALRGIDARSGGLLSKAIAKYLPSLGEPSALGATAGYTGKELGKAAGRVVTAGAAGAAINALAQITTNQIHDWATDDDLSILSGTPEAMGIGAIFGTFLRGAAELAVHRRTLTGRKQLLDANGTPVWHGAQLGEMDAPGVEAPIRYVDDQGVEHVTESSQPAEFDQPETLTPAEYFAPKAEAAAREIYDDLVARRLPYNLDNEDITFLATDHYNLPQGVANDVVAAVREGWPEWRRGAAPEPGEHDFVPTPVKGRTKAEQRAVEAELARTHEEVMARNAAEEEAAHRERISGGIGGPPGKVEPLNPRAVALEQKRLAEQRVATEAEDQRRMLAGEEPRPVFGENVAGRPGVAYSPKRTELAGTGSVDPNLGSRQDATGRQVPIVRHAGKAYSVTNEDTSGNPRAKPIGLQEVHEAIKAFGQFWGDLPILKADMRSAFAAQYNEDAEAAYSRGHGAVVDTAHEVGHHVWKKIAAEDQSFAETVQKPGPIHDELVALGKQLYRGSEPATGFAREGFSELVMLWMSAPERVRRVAPKAAQWLEGAVLMPRGELANRAKVAQQTFDQHRFQGNEKRVAATIAQAPNPLALIPRKAAQVKDLWQRFVSAWITDADGFIRAMKQADKLGAKLTGKDNVLTAFLALRGQSRSVMERFVKTETLSLDGNYTGPGLDVEISAWKGVPAADLNSYLIANRAISRPDRNFGETIESYQGAIGSLEKRWGADRMQKGLRGYHAWRERVLDYVTAADPILAWKVKLMREAEPAYTPAMRLLDEVISEPFVATGKPRSAATQGNLSKALTGGYQKIIDPFGQTLRIYEGYIAAAHQRIVLNALRTAADVPGMGAHVLVNDLAIPVPIEEAGMTMFQAPDPKVRAGMFTFNMDELVPGATDAKGGPLVKRVQVSVPRGVHQSLMSMNPQNVAAGMHWYTRAIRALLLKQKEIQVLTTTGASLHFVWFTNIARDFGSGMLFSKGKDPLRVLGEQTYVLGRVMADAAGEVAGGKIGDATSYPWRETYSRLGVGMANFATTHAGVSSTAEKLVLSKSGKAVRYVTHPVESLRSLAEVAGGISESPTRIRAIQQRATDLGWKPGDRMTLDVSLEMLAAGRGGNGVANFTEAGWMARQVNMFTPFFTAGIAGTRSAVRAAKAHPLDFGIKAGITMALGAWLWAHNKFGKENQEDGWYDRSTSRDRFGSARWAANVERPDGVHKTVHKIPLSNEVAMIFHLAEMALDAAYEKDPESAVDYLKGTLQGIPIPFPAAAGTMVELLTNERDYRAMFDKEASRPIEPEGAKALPVAERTGPYTTVVAMKVGEISSHLPDAFHVSPMKFDYLVRELTGSLGSDIAGIAGTRSRPGESGIATVRDWFLFLDRGSRIKMNSKPVNDLMDSWEIVDRASRSKLTPPSPRDQAIHKIQSDAVGAVWALGFLGSEAPSVEARDRYFKMANDVAADFLKQMSSGNFDPYRFEALRSVTTKAGNALRTMGANR